MDVLSSDSDNNTVAFDYPEKSFKVTVPDKAGNVLHLDMNK